MAVTRTAIVKLSVSDSDYDALEATFEQFAYACDEVADFAWSDDPEDIVTSQTVLHDATYEGLRDETDLVANHVQQARRRARDALERTKNDIFNEQKTSKPSFNPSSVVYDDRTITFFDDHCTLSTVDGRIEAEYVLPGDSNGTPQGKYFLSDEWDRGQSTIHRRGGEYYLHVTCEKERTVETDEDDTATQYGAVLGVDTNVDGYVAVTSTGSFIGKADEIEHRRREFQKTVGSMQEHGTQGAHRAIQSISTSFRRWKKDVAHQISKSIVEEAIEHQCGTIVFEDLEGIRDDISNDPKFQQWMFRRILDYTEYKATEAGIETETVDPSYTSQTCSHTTCRHVEEDNRDGDEFHCQSCGRRYHADYNAAKNVGLKYLQSRSKSGSGGATRQLALKSGTIERPQTSPTL